MMTVNRLRVSRHDDAGFTLVELIVAASITLLIGSMILGTVLTAGTSVKATHATTDLDGEATQLLNRLTGDLRQATAVWTTSGGVRVETPAITAVQNPFPGGTSTAVTSVTFNADFSGDGCIAGVVSDGCNPAPAVDPSDPETETFCWDPMTQLVYLIAGGVQPGSCAPTGGGSPQPLLSGHVDSFELSYESNNYLYDANGDGVTTWQELDAAGAPVGNGNGVLDGPELDHINAVRISLTVSELGHVQSDQTLVSLRNES